MMKPLLHLEDSADDALLIAELLRKEWPDCVVERVTCRASFQAALERGGFELILSDYSLPDLKGSAALELARNRLPDTPFIFLSGTIGEERAIEALKRGAADYVIKDRPDRLIAAIRQALRLREEMLARRRSEQALRLNQERHRLLVEHARDAIFALTEQGIITELNSAFARITGWRRDEWIGRHFRELVHPDDRVRALERIGRSLRGEAQDVFELRLHTSAGGTVDMEFTTTPHVPGLGVTGIARDVSERKRSLARLQEQAEIIDRAPVAVFINDLAHRIVYANDWVLQLCGLRREEVIGRTADAIFRPETLLVLAPARDATLRTGSWHGEIPIATPDGRQLYVEFVMSLIHDDAGQPRARLSVGIDVTERRRLETQLQRAARLDSIGLLAGGIAHDLNNVLAPIQIGVEFLRTVSDDPAAQRVLRTVEASARHGSSLVRQLVAFARGGEIERAELFVGPLLADVRELLVRTLPPGVEITTECAAGLGQVLADGTQLKQVLLNLCINARDAMPAGGRITLRAGRASAEELARHAPGVAARSHLRLSVSDTGTGMSPAVLARIFDPFFTTKAAGKGTGLGLSNVRGIVRKHEGVLAVESEVGRGTTFHLFLPERVVYGAAPGAAAPVGTRGDFLLVAATDVGTLRDLCAGLERAGFHTAGAAGLVAALDWLQHNRGRAGAVVADFAAPDAAIPEFVAAVGVLDPALPLVAVNGAGAQEPGVTHAGAADELPDILRRVMAGRREGS